MTSKSLLRRMDDFFFAPVSATGFGIARAVWGAGVLLWFLRQWENITRYYSGIGQIPLWIDPYISRPDHRISFLFAFWHPDGTFLVFILALVVSFLAMIGYRPRLTTILTAVLLFTFHERNPWHTSGGDIVLRVIGFILCIAPVGVHAFSVERLALQYRNWQSKRALLPPLMMPAWPKRLLLWQLILIYAQSFWSKMLGVTWHEGTAMAIAIHHPTYSRFPGALADFLSRFSRPLGYFVLAWEASWLLLLVPKSLPKWPQRIIRRCLIMLSLVMHTTFSILIRVGSFWPGMVSILIGIMQGEDFDTLRKLFNWRWRGKISVLYDGHCGMCRRSMCTLLVLDWLHRLRAVDFRNATEHHKWAPDISEAALDRALHVKFPSKRNQKGFSAFRALAWQLPLLWPAAPFLYLPGVKIIGDNIYAAVAKRRKQCSHDRC